MELNESGSIPNKRNGTSFMKSKSFPDWMERIDQESQFQLYLERNRSVVIRTVKNLSTNWGKGTIQYSIKNFVLDITAWTTLYQKNVKRLQQIILYLDKTLEAGGVGRGIENKRKDCQSPVLSKS